ncbi:MAG TPA: TauD/TfdA family dioxygenase [Polyangiaceae bacterium]|nr:TauD/TfdA family dioxygenase [Polyangiaceae bacterium]
MSRTSPFPPFAAPFAAPAPAMPGGPLGGAAAWRGSELTNSEAWILHLSQTNVAELEAAASAARRSRRSLVEIRREHFALPNLAPLLDDVRRELLDGRGFVLLRGLPLERYMLAEAATIFCGLGTHFGTALSQNAQGHVLGHVKDLGYDAGDPSTRLYQTNQRQGYHTDSADIVGLLCIRPARSGGRSSLASTVTAYNEVFARRPDLVSALFEPVATDHRGEVPPGGRPWFSIPVFSWYAGRLTGIYQRRYIESAQRFPDAPRLTARQREALDVFDAVLDDPAVHLEMDFRPGDVQLLHNHQILHDRTAFEDDHDPRARRQLLRLWLSPDDGRPLPPVFAERYGSVEPGRRGGVKSADGVLRAPLDV